MVQKWNCITDIMRTSIFLITYWVLITISGGASAIEFEVTSSDNSLRKEPKDNIKQYLSQLEIKPSDSNNFVQQQAKKQALLALQAVGYYQANVRVNITKDIVTVDVKLGLATLMGRSDFKVIGQGKNDPDFKDLRIQFPIVLGSKFHHGNYEANKARFNQLAQEKGYFDSRWVTSEVSVDLKENKAYLTQHFDTGPRYRFGKTLIPDGHPANDLIIAMQPYKSGEFYHSSQLGEFNFSLNKSQYFSSVQAIPDKPNVENQLVDIKLSLIDKPKNTVELALGYSTDTGPRASMVWTKPWLNRYGHSLITQATLNKDDSNIKLDYRLPHGDPNDDYTSVVLGWKDVNITGQNYEKYTLQWQRHQPITTTWLRTLSLKYEREYDRSHHLSTDLVVPGISYSRTRMRGGLAAYWGDRQLISLETANKAWGSSNNVSKLSVHSNWLRQYQDTHQWLLKLELGAIDAASINDVPNSMRFFSGGDDNLRAYGYKAVSPLILEDGKLIPRGGLYQALASIEYSYPIKPDWRIATFYDIGTTTDDFSEPFKSDAGIGARWQTPIGLIRLDFAWGLKKDLHQPFDRPTRISFAIGVNL